MQLSCRKVIVYFSAEKYTIKFSKFLKFISYNAIFLKKYPFDFLIPRGFEALRQLHFEKLLPRFWSCKQRGGVGYLHAYLKFSELFFACLNCVRNPIPKRIAKRIFENFSQKFCRMRAQTLKPFFLKRFFGQKIKINQISLLNEANLFEKELLFR